MAKDKNASFLRRLYRKMFSKKTRRKMKKRPLYALVRIHEICMEDSFFPEMERKSYLKRFMENVKWCKTYRSPCAFYNRFGIDVKDFHKLEDYLDFKYVKRDRAMIHHEGHPLQKVRDGNINTRYSIIADNKDIFYAYVGNIFPNNVPKTHFAFSGNQVIMPYRDDIDTKTAFEQLPDGKYICKPEVGSHGDYIVAFEVKGGNVSFHSPEENIDLLVEKSLEKPFLVQAFIKQHPEISRINSSSVNTVRVISTHWNEETHILAAMIRLGVDEDMVVDNADAGGTFVALDTETGAFDEYGYFYHKPRTTKHPTSGITYKGLTIPNWDEVIKIIKALHPIIFGFATIGWDIAITEDGPVIVEINWNYSLKGIQVCNGGLKPKWEELKSK